MHSIYVNVCFEGFMFISMEFFLVMCNTDQSGVRDRGGSSAITWQNIFFFLCCCFNRWALLNAALMLIIINESLGTMGGDMGEMLMQATSTISALSLLLCGM